MYRDAQNAEQIRFRLASTRVLAQGDTPHLSLSILALYLFAFCAKYFSYKPRLSLSFFWLLVGVAFDTVQLILHSA